MSAVLDPTQHMARLSVPRSSPEVGRQYLQSIKAQRSGPVTDTGARKALAALACWHDTPELYRRMVAHAAGLGREVVDKIDRDLSEREKELIRSAVRDMRGYFDSLVRI